MLCGSSYKNRGVQQVLDAIVDYLPAPTDVEAIKTVDLDGNPAGEIMATHRTHAAELVQNRLKKQAEQRRTQREAEALARQHAQKLGQLVEKFSRSK